MGRVCSRRLWRGEGGGAAAALRSCSCWATNFHPWWPLTALRAPRVRVPLRAGVSGKVVETCGVRLLGVGFLGFVWFCGVGVFCWGFFFFLLLLALVSLADVAAGGGQGSSVIAWDLGASVSSPFSSCSSAAVAKDFCNYRLKYSFDGK